MEVEVAAGSSAESSAEFQQGYGQLGWLSLGTRASDTRNLPSPSAPNASPKLFKHKFPKKKQQETSQESRAMSRVYPESSPTAREELLGQTNMTTLLK